MNKMEVMKALVEKLNEAAKAYYSGKESTLSDKEYDSLYEQLRMLESEAGIILPNSPTVRVGYEAVTELRKEKHEYPALSLDKTKDRDVLKQWLGAKEGILSWKCDGLTAVATWDDGKLTCLSTRGNGFIGENVTHNAPCIQGLPIRIKEKGHIVVRGEVVISYQDFEKINEEIENIDDKYKNPRNLAASSLRLLDSAEASKRKMRFEGFELVFRKEQFDTVEKSLEWMQSQGMNVVEHKVVDATTLLSVMEGFETALNENRVLCPTDGLVLTYNDVSYGKSLGVTGKFAKHSMAFKWNDDSVETILKDVEWSASRTGLINPVAVFESVELEGTTVSRASVHNLKYLQDLELGYGDTITVYKANKIIPQVEDNLTRNGNLIKVPDTCPVCGSPTVREFNTDNTSEFLYCPNALCPAKLVGRFTRLVERDALNVKGLSESTIKQFLQCGFLKQFSDLYHLDRFKDELLSMKGFGEKSYDNMQKAIENSRKTTFKQLFYALGIQGAGHDVAKILEKNMEMPYETYLMKLATTVNGKEKLLQMEGIGETTANAIIDWFYEHLTEYRDLCKELDIENEETETSLQDFAGKTFVITGKLESYSNRNMLKEEIESRGGKVSGSVSKNTNYLINNDVHSTSGKNKKAKELGVVIISEKQYKEL